MNNRKFENRTLLLLNATGFSFPQGVDLDVRSRADWYSGEVCEFEITGFCRAILNVEKLAVGKAYKDGKIYSFGNNISFSQVMANLGVYDDASFKVLEEEEPPKDDAVYVYFQNPAFYTLNMILKNENEDVFAIDSITSEEFGSLPALIIKNLQAEEDFSRLLTPYQNLAVNSPEIVPPHAEEENLPSWPKLDNPTFDFYVTKAIVFDSYYREEKTYLSVLPHPLLRRGFNSYSEALSFYQKQLEEWNCEPGESEIGNGSFFTDNYLFLTDKDGLELLSNCPQPLERAEKNLGDKYSKDLKIVESSFDAFGGAS